jgi:YidC/Oxa1 family membrane protein insertase
MSFIFHNVFYLPLLNALGLLIYISPGNSLGVAIIALTILVNLILLPLTHGQKKSQHTLKMIQPELDRIRQQFKDKKEEQARRTLELYREHGVNPFTGFLLLFLQLPIFFALFRIFRNLPTAYGVGVYGFLPILPPLHAIFLQSIDLTKPFIPLAVVAAIMQYFQGRMLMPEGVAQKKDDFSYILQQQFKYVIPVVVFAMGFKVPAALMLYWTTLSLFGIVHERVVRSKARSLKQHHGKDSGNTTGSPH